MHDENCLDHECWLNQGILGEILMEIRAELARSSHLPESDQTGTVDSPSVLPQGISTAEGTELQRAVFDTSSNASSPHKMDTNC